MTARARLPIVATALVLIATGGFIAQTTVPFQKRVTPKKLEIPPGLMADAEAPVTVVPGPDPLYTVFATGDVVGYIEPCG